MYLQNLPEDVLHQIINHLSDVHLDTLRFVCRRLNALATHRRFRKISLAPSIDSFKSWEGLLQNECIRSAVRRVAAASTPGRFSVRTTYKDVCDALNPEKKTESPDPLREIENLPHLREMCLTFSTICRGSRGGSGPGARLRSSRNVEQAEDRQFFLERAFNHMRKRDENPAASKIRRLEVGNLQNMPLPTLTSSDDFKLAIRNINELELNILTEYVEENDEAGLDQIERVEFEPYLHKQWLYPMMNQLTSLSLFFEDYWGTIPGTFNGKGLIFPHLKDLSLAYFAISHHDHLDWVLAQTSLTTLELEGCVIVCHLYVEPEKLARWKVATHDWEMLSPRNYGLSPTSRNETLYHFPGTWGDVYRKIRYGLPNLTELRSVAEWDHRYNTFNCTLPGEPWMAALVKGNPWLDEGVGEALDVIRAEETDEGDSLAWDELMEETLARMMEMETSNSS